MPRDVVEVGVRVERFVAVLLEHAAAILVRAAARDELQVDAALRAGVARRGRRFRRSLPRSRRAARGTVPKKLVPPLLKPLEELLMPSIVGLIVPPGMPL